MPTLIPDLTDGLRIEFDGTRLSATVPYHVADLDITTDKVQMLAQAMSVAGVPAPGTSMELEGRTLYAMRYSVGAWSDADAELIVTWVEDEAAMGGVGTEVEVGSTLEQGETDFTAEERAKPFLERSPMYVLWNPAVDGATVDSSEFRQHVRLPYFAGKPFRRYTKTLSEDPGALAEEFVGATNSTAWKGYEPEQVLCMGIVGRNAGNGGFRTTFDFAIDKELLWHQIGRARDRATGEFVAVTNAQLAGGNGIDEFVVQKQADFNDLPI